MPSEAEIGAWQEQLRAARERRHLKLHRAADRHMARITGEMGRWQMEIAEIESGFLAETERLDNALHEG